MDTTVILVFIFVYAGMMLGRIPCLALDRTGIALLGAIVLIAAGKIQPGYARHAGSVRSLVVAAPLIRG